MNILLQEWELPPFDQIKIEDYEPAVRAAIEEAERNVEAVATSAEEPTFENTVEALEVADRRLQRISAVMHCDQILVMEDGEAVGLGSHEELMKSCPLYQEIAQLQIGGEDT